MNHEIPRLIGRLEATVEDHGRRLSKLEERRRLGVPWMELLPYAYGIAMIVGALILVATGKLTAIEAIKAFGERLPI
jgi:hypothetical protein